MNRMALALIVLFFPAIAQAQDDPKLGVTISSPGAFGLIWQLHDRVAIRPEMTLSRTTSETVGGDATGAAAPVTGSDGTSVGVAASGLFYFSRKDAFRPYVSPRFSYSRSTSSSSTPSGTGSGTIAGASTSESTVSAYSGAVSLGAQYGFARRFSVWGELGGSYTRTNLESTSTFSTTVTSLVSGLIVQATTIQTVHGAARTNQYATRAAVGVIVYF